VTTADIIFVPASSAAEHTKNIQNANIALLALEKKRDRVVEMHTECR
jgi:hypothetical protein